MSGNIRKWPLEMNTLIWCCLILFGMIGHTKEQHEQSELHNIIINSNDEQRQELASTLDYSDQHLQIDKQESNTKITRQQKDENKQYIQTLESVIHEKNRRIDSLRVLTLDLHSYRDELKYHGDPIFVDSKNESHLLTCFQDLLEYYKLLNEFQNVDPIKDPIKMESISLADTFGRPEAGAFDGNHMWLGDYERCLEFEYNLPMNDGNMEDGQTSTRSIRSHYCLGTLQYENWDMNMTRTAIKIGLCLPETCTSSMLSEQKQLSETVHKMMMINIPHRGPYAKLKLRSVYCLPHPTSKLRQFDLPARIFIALMAFMLTIQVLVTIFDHFIQPRRREQHQGLKKAIKNDIIKNIEVDTRDPSLPLSSHGRDERNGEQQCQRVDNDININNTNNIDNNQRGVELESSWKMILIESLSITRNWKKLMSVRNDEDGRQLEDLKNEENLIDPSGSAQEVTLSFNQSKLFGVMAGIKSLALIWIMSGHVLLFATIQITGLKNLDYITETKLAILVFGANYMVDTFLVIMGLTTTFILFNMGIDRFELKHWCFITMHRYWRLTPLYILCCWYTKHLGSRLSSGPTWDYGTSENSPRYGCLRESWLIPLTHSSDFVVPQLHCGPFAWFLGNGFKFWLISPFLITQIYHSIKRGYSIILAVMMANIAIVYYFATYLELDRLSIMDMTPESTNHILHDMSQIYTRPYSRVGPYLIGLVLGHLFYMEKVAKIRIKMGKSVLKFAWTFYIFTSISLIFGGKVIVSLQLQENILMILFSLMSSIMRPLWALSTAWLLFALSHGQAPWLCGFLNAQIFKILVKLSFCAWLVSFEVIASVYFNQPHISRPIHYLDLLSKPMIVNLLTIIISFLIVLLVELPLVGLEKLVLPDLKNEVNHKIEKQKRQ